MCGKNNVILLSSTKSNKMGSKSNKNVYRYNHDRNSDLIKIVMHEAWVEQKYWI